MNGLILALLLAAPAPSQQQILQQRATAAANAREKALQAAVEREQVYSRPIVPGATETLQIPVTGKGIDSKGNVYTFSGIVTLSVETPAPPVTTKLTGIRDPATALPVTQAIAGQRLVLEGEMLTGGTALRVTVGGEIAAVTRQSAGMVEFTVPPVPAGRAPELKLFWLVGNNWQPKGTLPLTVKGAPPPPPPVPGANPRVDSLERSGEHITLTGSGFGSVAGRLLLDKRPALIVSWADGRIDCLGFAGQGTERLVIDLLRPGAGWFTEMWERLP